MSSLEKRISIPDWVLPAAVATGAAVMIGLQAYLNVRHEHQMAAMQQWYEQNPVVFELKDPAPTVLDSPAPPYRNE